MSKFYLTLIIGLLLILNVTAQKFSFNNAACDPTSTKIAIKYFKQSVKAKKSEDRKTLLNKAIEADPDYYEAHFQMGIKNYVANYARPNNTDATEAIEHLERVKTICPKYSPYTFYMLGKIYLGQEKWKIALENFKKFMEFDDIDDNEKYGEIKEMLPDLEEYADLITNPVPFDPHPVEGVCTALDEYLGSLSPDNRNFYYIRKTFK